MAGKPTLRPSFICIISHFLLFWAAGCATAKPVNWPIQLPNWSYKPFIGIESQVQYLGYEAQFGQNVFPSEMVGFGVHGGFLVNPHLSFELGFNHFFGEDKHALLGWGQTIPGYSQPLPSNYWIRLHSHTKLSELRLSASTYMQPDFLPNQQLFASFGLLLVYYRSYFDVVEDSAGVFPEEDKSEFHRKFSSSSLKPVPMIKVGWQYFINDKCALTLGMHAKYYSVLNSISSKENRTTAAVIKFSSCAGLSVGLEFFPCKHH